LSEVGGLLAPAVAAVAFALGLGWRPLFWVAGGAAMAWALFLLGQSFPSRAADSGEMDRTPWSAALAAARDPAVLRPLALLALGSLLADNVWLFCALYFRDVLGVSAAAASAALAVLVAGVLGGRLLLMVAASRCPARRLLRLATWASLLAYGGWLLAPGLALQYGLTAVLGVTFAAYYPLLKAEAIAARPDRSGTVSGLVSLAGATEAAGPLLLGLLAAAVGLDWALATLALAPLGMLVLMRSRRPVAQAAQP
jgi:Na+/melibiose symporter-like transporter